MRAIHRFTVVESTMLEAAALAAAGAESGTVVVTDQQTAGQGRLGRRWHSEPGAGLYMTQILRHKICAESVPLVTLSLGLATAEAITHVAGVACDLRWPNDVLVNGKKCAGILAQLTDGVVLAGIGVNVNHTSFPDEIAPVATSLRIATGREQSREDLLAAVADSVDAHLNNLMHNGAAPVLKAFSMASSYVYGRRVVVDMDGSFVHGTTDGLHAQGFLFVRQDDGVRKLVLAGGVRPACS